MTRPALPLRELLGRTPALVDGRGRVKRKLRISLTDRCNFRCSYCMPDKPRWLPRDALLTRAELAALSSTFVDELGITQVRLTGGEPLLRRDLAEIVADLSMLKGRGLTRISLTSNGALLEKHIGALRDAGLDDLNVSLDARTPEIFRTLTGAPIEPTLRGIDAARARGVPVKLNAVVVRGYNDAEILPLARWALGEGLELRFIEFMPLDGRGAWSADKVVSEREILDILRRELRVEALARDTSPATPYRAAGGRLGVISTVSNPFCASCDRVRLTATGELYTCLFGAKGTDLSRALRENPAQLTSLARAAVWDKPAGYAAQPGYVQRDVSMHHLGG